MPLSYKKSQLEQLLEILIEETLVRYEVKKNFR